MEFTSRTRRNCSGNIEVVIPDDFVKKYDIKEGEPLEIISVKILED